MKKRKYDTAVVMLYLLGKEALLPHSFRKQIPFSTISSWRKVDYTSYIGHEYRFLFEDRWDVLVLQKQVTALKRQLSAILKAWLPFKREIQVLIHDAKNDRLLQKKIVAAVDVLSKVLSLKTALRLLGLNATQYREWKVLYHLRCGCSQTSLCLRRFPNQLSQEEVRKIKALLTSSKFQHWPVVSIAAYALRKGFLKASLFSWYKYSRFLQMPPRVGKRWGNLTGLQATAPNEYWHADSTYYELYGAKKICITFVMDNYSKMILGFAVNEKRCFALIKEALTNALQTAAKQTECNSSYLVTDGGGENKSIEVHKFLTSLTEHKLVQKIALKDIQFSNSPVESIHHILKSRYLRNQKFRTLEELTQFLNLAVQDYNCKRPHCRLQLKTPEEAYFGIPLSFDPKQRMLDAVKQRVQKNKQTACNACHVIQAYSFHQPTLSTSTTKNSTYDQS
ncbi:DDE-type integrase/transposase/recombinase [Flavisolibacter nicotianae]|uniref:DDE-type integrase/transposase/recombinase n=1 Tax=Flavisolibacter nicotianae TaxID=2364882 RepID=UPI0013C3EE9C|nr:DDE-type integrase/transposase/recombinase [Flavisolibacter nicotianae]